MTREGLRGGPAILALRRWFFLQQERLPVSTRLVQHRVVREVAGSVSIASVGCGNLDTRLCACREERTAVSVGEISCPRSAHLQRGAVSGSSFQGAWRQASGAGGLLSFLPFSLQSMTIRQWQGRGSGGAQALVWLFVCCTRCVFGCGGAAGTSAFVSPTYCCCKVGLVCRDSGAGRLLCPSYLA